MGMYSLKGTLTKLFYNSVSDYIFGYEMKNQTPRKLC